MTGVSFEAQGRDLGGGCPGVGGPAGRDGEADDRQGRGVGRVRGPQGGAELEGGARDLRGEHDLARLLRPPARRRAPGRPRRRCGAVRPTRVRAGRWPPPPSTGRIVVTGYGPAVAVTPSTRPGGLELRRARLRRVELRGEVRAVLPARRRGRRARPRRRSATRRPRPRPRPSSWPRRSPRSAPAAGPPRSGRPGRARRCRSALIGRPPPWCRGRDGRRPDGSCGSRTPRPAPGRG